MNSGFEQHTSPILPEHTLLFDWLTAKTPKSEQQQKPVSILIPSKFDLNENSIMDGCLSRVECQPI